MFFTISNTSFPVYYFGALSFSTVLSKCISILRYLCFLGKNHRCRIYTNFLDDGRYTDAVPSTQIGHAPLFPLVCPDNVKPSGSIMDANEYDCIQCEILLLILVPHTHPFIPEFFHIFNEWFQKHINIGVSLLQTLDKNIQYKVLSFVTQPCQKVVHHEDD
jgi:hypothetical protein